MCEFEELNKHIGHIRPILSLPETSFDTYLENETLTMGHSDKLENLAKSQ